MNFGVISGNILGSNQLFRLCGDRARAWRNVFDLSVSGRPGSPDQAGGGEKTKTRKQGPGGGPGAPRALRPRAKVGWESGGPMGRWAGRVVDRPGRSGRSMGRSGWLGSVVLLLGWPECMEIRLFRGVSATKPQTQKA